MIGAELLQLLQGDPLAQMRAQMQPAPNPNPQAQPAPQQLRNIPGGATGPTPGTGYIAPAPPGGPPMSPAPPNIGGPPGHFEILNDQAHSPHWVPGPATVNGAPLPGRIGPAPLTKNPDVAPGPQGAPPAPGGAPPPSPTLPQSGPPSVASQSPPDLAQLYMRLMQQQRSGNEIDRGLALMASAYAAPGTQGQIMHSMDNMQQDPSAMMNNLVQLQQLQNLQNLPQPGTGGGTAAGLAPGGGTGGGQQPAFDARTWALMSPQAKQDWIEKNAQSGLQVQTAAKEGQAKDVEEFKNTAIQDFSPLNQKLTESESMVDQLIKNPTATMQALQYPGWMTTDKTAAWLPFSPVTDAAKQQAIAIQKLEAELTGESLSNVKNVRNQREFSTLGEALTAGLNANNGQEGVQKALQDIKQRMAVAHAQVYATAGKEIPNQYAGLADPRYTSTTFNGAPNPYYTGATYEPAAKEGGSSAGGGAGKTYTYNPKTGQLE